MFTSPKAYGPLLARSDERPEEVTDMEAEGERPHCRGESALHFRRTLPSRQMSPVAKWCSKSQGGLVECGIEVN